MVNILTIYNISRKDLIAIICEKQGIDQKDISFTALSSTGLKIGARK